jgi:peptidoglycan/LPS O-acetylase OafA/YrhL
VHGFVPSANNHIVPGGWSIGTEMAFYLIFPLLYRFLDKKPGKRILMAALSFAAAAIGNLAIQYLILAKTAYGIYNNSFLYFNLINQLPVFLLGFLYFFLVKDTKRLGALLASRALGIVGFAACTALSIAILLFFRQQLLFALLPTVAGCAFVFLVNLLRIKRRPLGLVGKIGKVSYSMYIFHFLFAWMLVPWMFRGLPAWISPDLQLVLAFGLSVAGSYLIAIITERFIEEGGIAMGGRIIQKFKPDRCIMPVAE